MRRREFIAGISATAWALAVRAQPQSLPVVGVLIPGSEWGPLRAAFMEGLAETGYVEGRNVVIETRLGDTARFPEMAGIRRLAP